MRGRTLALRLTLWYAGVFAASALLAFAFAYVVIVALVRERMDEDLSEDIEEFAELLRAEGLAGVEREMRLDTRGEDAEKLLLPPVVARRRPSCSATDLRAFPDLAAPPASLLQSRADAEPRLGTLAPSRARARASAPSAARSRPISCSRSANRWRTTMSSSRICCAGSPRRSSA